MRTVMKAMKYVISGICMLALMNVSAQDGTVDPVLMRVDEQPVTRGEFEAIYKKNNKDASVTKEALDEYLELFINYKLKVGEAEVLGMDTVAKFKQELAGYRDQLARPYLIDRELNEELIREAYDRSMVEVRAAHILVQLAPDASPEDTAAAWKRISTLRARVIGGEDFAVVARSKGGSDDPSAQQNGGDLGWFSAMQMVYPFENAAYRTEVGEVSAPVRTRFGYHIIKVSGKREARGQMKVAHIMLRASDQDNPDQIAAQEKKADEIHMQIMAGTLTFEDAALKYSEDEGSNTKGGELPVFGTGKMIEEFEDVAFGLTKDGEVSEPFKSRFGWHIVKRLEFIPPPTYDQAKGELKSKIGRDSRADITRQAFLGQIKKEYHYTPYTANLKPIYPLVDTTVFKKGAVEMDTLLRADLVEGPLTKKGVRYRRELNGVINNGTFVNVRNRKYSDLAATPSDTVVVRDIQEGWTYDRKKAEKLTKAVFTIDGKSYSQADFLNYLEEQQKRERVMPTKTYVDGKFNSFVDDMLMAYEDDQLETKYPEFRMLMKEYRDGILLFELTDQKVWSKAVKDTVGLEAYYEANKMDFMWDTRYVADVYTCANADVAKQVRSLYKKGMRGEELVKAVKVGSPLDLDLSSGKWTAAEKPFLKGLTQPGLTDNFSIDDRIVIVDMMEVLPSSPKSLSEARGLVTAAYQDSLEKAWIKELRAKYPVVIDQDVLYSIQ